MAIDSRCMRHDNSERATHEQFQFENENGQTPFEMETGGGEDEVKRTPVTHSSP